MPNPVWPVSLPQSPLVEGYSGEEQSAVLRTEMDAGEAKSRRRFSATPDKLNCSFSLTEAQFTTFKTFFNGSLLRGSLPFDWLHPESGAAVSCRLIRYRRSLRGTRRIISCEIEVLP